MGEDPHFILLPLKFGNIDLSITNEVVMLWIAAAVTLAIFLPAAREHA